MAKVHADEQRTEGSPDDRDVAMYVDDEEARALLSKHMSQWSTLLERLK